MTGSLGLQLFLLVNVFFVGVITTIAVQHAMAHFRPHPHPEEAPAKEKPANPASAPGGHLPAEVKQRLLQQSEASFQAVLTKTTGELQHDLESTAVQLNKVVQKIGSDVVNTEMERYRTQLEQIRQQAENAITGAQSEIGQHQAALTAEIEAQRAAMTTKMAEEIAAEKQRLVAEIDAVLADAVASFLMETLQHNVDLGAQSSYLTAMLEEHKAELVKGMKE